MVIWCSRAIPYFYFNEKSFTRGDFMVNKSGIYKIINITNNKLYVGSAVKIQKRWNEHINFLSKNKHHNRYLQNAWNKHGQENFKFEVIEYIENVSKKTLLEREQYWINKTQCYNSNYGYNIQCTAGSNLGIVFSEEHKSRISKALTGKKLSKEQIEKMRNRMLGTKLSEDHKFKLINSRKGIKLTQEQIDMLAEARRAKPLSEESKRKIGDANKGRVVSLEVRKRISESEKGEKHHNTKLTNEIVIEIKQMLCSQIFTYKEIAEQFQISRDIVQQIKDGSTWTHIIIPEFTNEQIKNMKIKSGRSVRGNHHKLKEEQVKLIKKMLFDGYTLDKISKIYNVDTSVISCIKLGKTWSYVIIPEASNEEIKNINKKERKLNTENILEIKDMLASGHRGIDIAEKFKVSEGTISLIKNNNTWKKINKSI
jgi:group I intron endonuclease